MARPIRVAFPGAVYHVTARGNERRAIYRDDADRECFLEMAEEVCERFGVLVHAFCLMPNHFHLLLQTPRANLSAAAGWLQTTYSIRFNRRHRRVAIWLRVRGPGERMTEVAAAFGYRDGSRVHRVVRRLEEAARHGDAQSKRLKAWARDASRGKS